MMPRTTRLFAVGLVLLAVACAGGKKKPPMTPAEEDTSVDNSAWSSSSGDGGAGTASSSGEGGTDKAPAEEAPQGTEDGARALLAQFSQDGADHAALTKNLRPTAADYKALFEPASASKIEAALAKDWDKGKVVIDPKPKQTDLKIWAATSEDLASGKGNAKEFPGAYKKVAKRLAAGITLYRFKFAEPGKGKGAKSFDGLAFVNGHWVLVPKPWIAFGKG